MTSLSEWIDMKIRDDDIIYYENEKFSNFDKVEGAFGIVKRAYWKSCGIKIALKILTNNSINHDNMNKFLKEVWNIFSIYSIFFFQFKYNVKKIINYFLF